MQGLIHRFHLAVYCTGVEQTHYVAVQNGSVQILNVVENVRSVSVSMASVCVQRSSGGGSRVRVTDQK